MKDAGYRMQDKARSIPVGLSRLGLLECELIRRRAAALALALGVLLGLGVLIGSQAVIGPVVAAPHRAANPGDVVINEVAWGGTAASAADEWIELYNNTDAAINLTGWTLTAADGTPSITLNGTIPAHGYFLLERIDDNTVSDIPADQIYTGDLGNGGEALQLKEGVTVIDSANGNGGAWPAGTASPTYKSMERINPAAPDTDANWASNDGVTRNGRDANNNPLNGTPKARNSATPIPAADLSIRKAGPASVLPGAQITYTIAFSNVGTLDAAGVVITDVLPAAVTYQSDTSGYPVSEPMPGTRVWTVGAVGVTSSTITFQVVGQVSGGATGDLTNAITITTATTETVTANNHDTWVTSVGSVGQPQVLISAVLYDGYQTNDTDEAIQLINVGTASADLTGWELCKDASGSLSCRTLPSTVLAPGSRLWLARDATSFTTSFGFAPDYQMSSWLSNGLTNTGDEVVLRDGVHATRDALVYKAGTSVAGWSGPAVQPYSVGREAGQILYRIPDETTGLPITDTNTAADWIQYTDNYTQGRRVLYPGWDLDPFFWPLTVTEAATVTVGIAPDNAFPVVAQTILGAQRSITVEVYALRHPEVITALVQQARAGVQVDVLLEGQQAGLSVSDPRWQQELWACREIEAAGGRCWFMIHEPGDNIFNRYDYLHAKFLVVDDEWVLITSQNLTASSMPADDKSNGTYGSRGVVLVTNAPAVVARARQVLARDLDPAHHNDILRWNTAYTDKYGPPDAAYTPVLTTTDYTTYTVRFPAPLTTHGTLGFELFTAPEAALRQSDALLGLVRRAGPGDAVYVEQMYEYPTWGTLPVSPNLRLEAYIAAARRGAQVRILLNGGSFGEDYVDLGQNQAAVAYVNGLAQREGLDLRAALGDPTQYGIHNKMVLVWLHDQGGYAHVGSINGSESSNKVNREIAIQVRSDEVYGYLKGLFDLDWNLANPTYLPLVMRGYRAPDHVVISEVLYRPSGQTTGNREWVELYNPTGQAINLADWYLGDAAAPGEYGAGLYRFPAGAVLPAGGVIVIAQQAADFQPVGGFTRPHYEFLIDPGRDDPTVPNMVPAGAWSGFGFKLGDGGDKVILRDANGVDVDVVVYGAATYPGVNPHPGGVEESWSLERRPPHYDTNDCAVDFVPRYPATPGHVNP